MIDNPSVVNVWDITTKIVVASFLFEKLPELRSDKVEEVLKDLLEANREFVLIAFLSIPREKRIEWATRYPFLLNKLAKNELMGDIVRAIQSLKLSYA